MADTKVQPALKTNKVSDDYMPSLYLNERQLPQIKTWRVGGRYRLIVDVEEISMNIGQDQPDIKKRQTSASFRIISIKPVETTASKDAIMSALAKKAKEY